MFHACGYIFIWIEASNVCVHAWMHVSGSGYCSALDSNAYWAFMFVCMYAFHSIWHTICKYLLREYVCVVCMYEKESTFYLVCMYCVCAYEFTGDKICHNSHKLLTIDFDAWREKRHKKTVWAAPRRPMQKCPHTHVQPRMNLIKTFHQDLSSRSFIKIFHRDLSSRSFIKIFHQDLSSRSFIEIFHQDLSSRSFIKVLGWISCEGNHVGLYTYAHGFSYMKISWQVRNAFEKRRKGFSHMTSKIVLKHA
jgi:hypothetical protein